MKRPIRNFFKRMGFSGGGCPRCRCAPLRLLPLLGLIGLVPLPELHADTSWLERREMSYARRAFEDGLYDVARLKLERFIENRPKSDFAVEAGWLLGQSHYFLGDYDRALARLKNVPPGADERFQAGHLYWLGETLASLDRHGEAADIFRQYLEKFPQGENRIESRLSLSQALDRNDQPEEALAALQPLLDADPASPEGLRARLQLAKFDLQNGNYAAAAQTLQTLRSGPAPRPLLYEIKYWSGLSEIKLKNYPQAAALFQELTEDPQAHPRELVVRAWMGLGQARQQEENWDEASRAYQQAYRLSLDARFIESSVLEFLNCQHRQGTLAKGAIDVRKFAARNPQVALSGIIAIGHFYYQDRNYDACIAEMDNLVQDYPDSDQVWTARLLIARAFDAKGDADAAIKSYRAVIDQTAVPSIALLAHQDLARFYFQRGQYAEAAGAYQSLAEAGRESPALRESATFSALKALAAADRVDDFAALETKFHQAFPQSGFQADLLMIKARLYRRAGQDETARTLFAQLAEAHPKSRQAADALFALGSSYYEAGLYDQAAATLKIIEQQHPKSPEITEAIYLRILSDLNTGQLNHEEARQQLTSLGDAFSDSPLLPKIRFKAAFTWVEQGRYVDALGAMTALMRSSPHTPEAEYAAYLAGRSAMHLKKFREAIASFEEVPQDSIWKVHSHLAQIRCYMAQGEFKSALEIADALLAKTEPGPVRAEALLRKADCLITDGAETPESYLEAFKAVEGVLAGDKSSVAQRNEAGFLKGRILQKQGKPSEALEAYLDVVYGKLIPPDAPEQSILPETHFFIESGVTAAQMLKDSGDVRGAVEVYRILERLSAPHRNQFRRAIEDLKTQHFIYEET